MSLTFISNDTSFHAECYTIALMFIIMNKINLGLSYCLQEYICSSVLSLSLLPCYQPANLSLDKFKTIIILSQPYSISCISNNRFLLYLDKVMKINYRGLCFRSGSIPRTSSSTVGSSSTWGTVGILDSLLSNVRSQKVANGDFDRNFKISIHNLIN